MGSLIVYQTKATTKVTTENATMVFSVSGSQGDYWNVGQVEIDQNDQPQLVSPRRTNFSMAVTA